MGLFARRCPALLALMGLVLSCNNASDYAVTTSKERSLLAGLDAPEDVDIISKAKYAAASYGKLRGDKLEATHASRVNEDVWSITICRIPAVPGGFYDVEIRRDGTVEKILQGE